VKIIPGPGAVSPRKAPERRSENAGKRGNKLPLPCTPRTSAVTITVKEGSGQSYADNIPLAEVDIKAVGVSKVITGGIVLDVSKDQKREKAAKHTSRLIEIVEPSKVRVAAPFQAVKARVVEIDV
jgi:hypothetical protein